MRSIFLIGALLSGCNFSSPAPPSRIVLITLPGVGTSELPELASLQSLAQKADWAGRGVAASSHLVPAAASLFTGLSPWNHQVLHAGQSYLREDLLTLAEALGELGYRGVGVSGNSWTSKRTNYDQGFDHFEHFTPDVAKRLGKSSDGKEFFWVQLRPLSSQRQNTELRRAKMPALDAQLNLILEALETSDSWPETLLVVTAEHGPLNLGRGKPLGPLDRHTLEVPLLIRLPEGTDRSIATDTGKRVSLRRVWATIVESAGGQSVPAAAASLYREVDEAIVSELYRAQGANHFSLVVGNLQLLRRVAYLVEEGLQGRRWRQAADFAVTRPISGLGRRETVLLQWEPGGGTLEVADESRRAELDEALDVNWRAFVDLERTPSRELALRPRRPRRHLAELRSQSRPKQRSDH